MVNNLLFSTILVFSSTNAKPNIYTPKGTKVSSVYNVSDEFEKKDIDKYNDEYDSKYPYAIRFSTATRMYNCHSYAWYSQDYTTNKYWIDDPSVYYTDGSYIEIPYTEVQPRDRILYFNSINSNVHSGIVVSKSYESPNNDCGAANTVIVQSKWGTYGLYQHKGNYCPYVPYYEGEVLEYDDTGNPLATDVKFYRYNIKHTHSYKYTFYDKDYHKEECECGMLIVPHNFVLNKVNSIDYSTQYIPKYQCQGCGYISLPRD